jgi:hypothetical protein
MEVRTFNTRATGRPDDYARFGNFRKGSPVARRSGSLLPALNGACPARDSRYSTEAACCLAARPTSRISCFFILL